MRLAAMAITAITLAASTLACCTIPAIPKIEFPDIDVKVPIATLEIGPVEEAEEIVPLGNLSRADVELALGAGSLDIRPGTTDALVKGTFRYNVTDWRPVVALDDDTLAIRQGGLETGLFDGELGIPTGDVINEWQIALSPEVPVSLDIKAAAVDGEFQLGGLDLEEISLAIAAGEVEVDFDAPGEGNLRRLSVEAGASALTLSNVGNAQPERISILGGVGDLVVDFSGEWTRSSKVDIKTGIGSTSLRVPDDIGVRVTISGGLSNVEVVGLRKSGSAYVNNLYGDSDIELLVDVATGVGRVSVVETSSG